MTIDPNTVISPPTDAEQARTGWKMQRRQFIADAAEHAADLLAAERGVTVRSATVTVLLPVELSTETDRDGEPTPGEDAATPVAVTRTIVTGEDADGKPITERQTVLRTHRERVTVEWTGLADPRRRWTPAALTAAAFRAADRERRTIRPRPSREAGEEAAAAVVERVLTRTAGFLPFRGAEHGVTDTYLRAATRGILLNAERLQEDANGEDALPDAATVAGDAAAAALAAADGDWAAGLTDPTADPRTLELRDAAATLDLPDRAVWAAAAELTGIGPVGVSKVTGQEPNTARQMLKRGRADLRTIDPDRREAAARAAFRSERGPVTAARRKLTAGDDLRRQMEAGRERVTVPGLTPYGERVRTLQAAARAAAARDDRDRCRQLLAAARRAAADRPRADSTGPVCRSGERAITPPPDRYPTRDRDADPGVWEVGHAPVTVRTADPADLID